MKPSNIDNDLLDAMDLIRTEMNKTVLEIAQENAEDYTWMDDHPNMAPIITLLDVALSSKHRWDVVLSTLNDFVEKYPGCSLKRFPEIVKADNKRRFVEKWFFQDLKRFAAIEKLAARFVRYKDDLIIDTEFEAMQHWAKSFMASDGWPDPTTNNLIKGISALDIVDIQYLLMRVGVSTVKPDNRLKLVFENLEIPFKDDIDLIRKGHELADLLHIDPLVFDQMFW